RLDGGAPRRRDGGAMEAVAPRPLSDRRPRALVLCRQAPLATSARLHLRALARRRRGLVAVPVPPRGGRDRGGSPPRTRADRERAAGRRALLRHDPRARARVRQRLPDAYSFVADHFQYLASLPLIALAAAGATRLPRPQVIGAAVLLALGALAWR